MENKKNIKPGLSITRLNSSLHPFTKLILCFYLSLSFVLPFNQLKAEETCNQCPVDPELAPPKDGKLELFYKVPVDPSIPTFMEKLKEFRHGPYGMFNKSFFMGTGGAAGQTFQIHHSHFTTAVEAIKKMVNDGDASYEKISLPDSQGTVDVTDSFIIKSSAGGQIAPSPENVPERKDFYIRWVSVFGTTFVFREKKADQPVGLVTYFQLFGWVPETWRPELSKQQRCKEFINAKYSEPQVNATQQAMLTVGEESLKMFLPGYSGWDKVWNTPQKLLGVFETLVGLATLGFYGKVNSMRKAIAWTTIGLASAQLSAALIYQPTVGEVGGAVLPAVLVIPYTLPVKWVRQVTAGGLIWYQMTFGDIDSRILQRIKNLPATVPSPTQAMTDLDKLLILSYPYGKHERELRIEQGLWAVAQRNFRENGKWMVSLPEMELNEFRVDGLLRALNVLNRQKGLPRINYEEALQDQIHFAGLWAAWNKYFKNGTEEGHNAMTNVISYLLPNKAYLKQSELDNLLIEMIKDPQAFKARIAQATNWEGKPIKFEVDELFSDAFKPQDVQEWVYRALKGFLISTKRYDKKLYRLVPTQIDPQTGQILKINTYPGARACGKTPEAVAEFAKQFEPGTTFAIMEFDGVIGSAGVGEGYKQFLAAEFHGMAVKNEVVAFLGDLASQTLTSCTVTAKAKKDKSGNFVDVIIPIVKVTFK